MHAAIKNARAILFIIVIILFMAITRCEYLTRKIIPKQLPATKQSKRFNLFCAIELCSCVPLNSP